MNNVEFQKIYLEILSSENDKIINESLGKTLAGAALVGSALFGAGCSDNLNAASVDTKQPANVQISKQQINNSSEQKIEKTAQTKKIQLSEDELFIAKTIYSEASTLCTYEEHIAIGRIIQNRIGHKGFEMGRLKNAVSVVKQPKAFTSVLKHNKNWDQYKIYLNKFSKFDAQIAKILVDPSKRLGGPSWMNDIVYYHDKSIDKPSNWDNKYWKAVLVKETPKFKFYKVVENKTPKKTKKIKRR